MRGRRFERLRHADDEQQSQDAEFVDMPQQGQHGDGDPFHTQSPPHDTSTFKLVCHMPAGRASSKDGTNCTNPMSPRSSARPVTAYIRQPTATDNI
jgi:hypothetical protein